MLRLPTTKENISLVYDRAQPVKYELQSGKSRRGGGDILGAVMCNLGHLSCTVHFTYLYVRGGCCQSQLVEEILPRFVVREVDRRQHQAFYEREEP